VLECALSDIHRLEKLVDYFDFLMDCLFLFFIHFFLYFPYLLSLRMSADSIGVVPIHDDSREFILETIKQRAYSIVCGSNERRLDDVKLDIVYLAGMLDRSNRWAKFEVPERFSRSLMNAVFTAFFVFGDGVYTFRPFLNLLAHCATNRVTRMRLSHSSLFDVLCRDSVRGDVVALCIVSLAVFPGARLVAGATISRNFISGMIQLMWTRTENMNELIMRAKIMAGIAFGKSTIVGSLIGSAGIACSKIIDETHELTLGRQNVVLGVINSFHSKGHPNFGMHFGDSLRKLFGYVCTSQHTVHARTIKFLVDMIISYTDVFCDTTITRSRARMLKRKGGRLRASDKFYYTMLLSITTFVLLKRSSDTNDRFVFIRRMECEEAFNRLCLLSESSKPDEFSDTMEFVRKLRENENFNGPFEGGHVVDAPTKGGANKHRTNSDESRT
jgi:hypothetical protein